MQSLWRKEHNSQLYVDIFKGLTTNSPNPCKSTEKKEASQDGQTGKKNRKCDEKAVEMRKAGNTQFDQQNWMAALSCYNESLRFAEIGSENVALAYANRSSCFLQLKMYDKCLVDIELAKFADYPENLMPKLDKRRAECLELLKTGVRFEEVAPQLSYEVHESFPGMANVLEIKYGEPFGRHIVAKCDIEVGQMVLLEEAFVTQKFVCTHYTTMVCETCTKEIMNFVPCSKCPKAQFCSTDCMAKDEFHKMECQTETNANNCWCQQYRLQQANTRAVLFGIKIFPSIEDLIEFVDDTVRDKSCKVPQLMNDAKSKYRAFLQLFVLPRTKTDKAILAESYAVYTDLLSRDSIKTKFDTTNRRNFLKHLIVHCRSIIFSNAFNCVDQEAVFNLFSYFNHSCTPNLIYANHGTRMMCITIRQIKKGQQLFVNYIQPAETNPSMLDRSFRRLTISRDFGFKCNSSCEKCKSSKWQRNGDRFTTDSQFIALEKELRDFFTSSNRKVDPALKRKTSLILRDKCIELLVKYANEPWNKGTESIVSYLSLLLKI